MLAQNNNYNAAHVALGFAYLIKGDFTNGWQEHTWYLKNAKKNADELRALLAADAINGSTILLRPEGGLGDTIHFIRYAQRLKNMGATVIVTAQKPLLPLLSHCPYIDQLLTPSSLVPKHDASSTLMSMPAVFQDTEQTMPRDFPYIYPDPKLETFWKTKLAKDTHFKIGICWQADVYNDASRLLIARRGVPLKEFYCLKNIPGISLYSLQKKEGLEQLDSLPIDFKINLFDADSETDFDESHGPFMDTAAIMQQLDLIICCDSAVAHLAGALGKPVWLMLPYATDWRWITGRTDSPWYPTMRIFKQPKPFDWQSSAQEVYNELRAMLKNRASQMEGNSA